jgi:hypothetical protein
MCVEEHGFGACTVVRKIGARLITPLKQKHNEPSCALFFIYERRVPDVSSLFAIFSFSSNDRGQIRYVAPGAESKLLAFTQQAATPVHGAPVLL